MLRVDAGGAGPYCDGLSRRNFVQLGVAGMATVGLPSLLQAGVGRSSDTRVILVWLDGGPGHMDLYDMKPEAPAEYRGFWRPMKTNVPGFEITELFPRQAKVADRFSIVRSLHHGSGDHFAGAHIMLTSRWGANGSNPQGARYPSVGSVAAQVAGARKSGLPAYVAVPYASSVGIRPGYFGGNYLGQHTNPFETDGDPNQQNYQVANLVPPGGLSVERLDDRRRLKSQFDTLRRDVDSTGLMETMTKFEQQAYELVASAEVRKAFDLSAEDPALRDRYGRTNWGQSTLLARRLAEAGVTFTTVHMGGWDHHWNLKEGMEQVLPQLDMAMGTLFDDLAQRGLWEKVLVVLCGEFSRTPRMNDGGNGGAAGSMGTPGRDHWGDSMFCLMGGGGVKGGVIVGATDDRGEYPKERPLKPEDIHATMYHALGVDPEIKFLDPAGRPVPVLDHGEPIRELI